MGSGNREAKYRAILSDRFEFQDNILLMGYRGSIAHGMYVEGQSDDVDLMGIYAPPIEYVLGLRYSKGVAEVKADEVDFVGYEIRKFINLLLAGNPNVVGMLWLNENHYIIRTALGDMLIQNREIFTGRDNIYKSFGGYASGQLRDMERGKTGPGAYSGYMGARRKELVDKYGYDIKNAAHALRLLAMGVEYLTSGELNVFRHDAQRFLAVKNGEWPIEKVKGEGERLFSLLEEAYVKSPLPDKPDIGAANKLCIEILERFYGYDSGCREADT